MRRKYHNLTVNIIRTLRKRPATAKQLASWYGTTVRNVQSCICRSSHKLRDAEDILQHADGNYRIVKV